MAKKDLKLTIEEDLLIEMKEKIPNISKFLSEHAIIHLRADSRPEHIIREEIVSKQHLIMEAEQELEYLQAQLNNLTGYNQDQKEREGMVWRKLWSYYRETQQTHHKFMDPAVEVLKESEETLMELMNHIATFMERGDGIKVTDWDYVKEKYLPEVKR